MAKSGKGNMPSKSTHKSMMKQGKSKTTGSKSSKSTPKMPVKKSGGGY